MIYFYIKVIICFLSFSLRWEKQQADERQTLEGATRGPKHTKERQVQAYLRSPKFFLELFEQRLLACWDCYCIIENNILNKKKRLSTSKAYSFSI